MILIKIKRVIKAGFINFWRNGLVSLVAVLIMIVTLFVIGSLIFDRAVLISTLNDLKDKVDISVYFKNNAQEEGILDIKEKLEKLNEVKNVEYISREQALEEFKERHKNNALILQSLEELDENPLGAVLNIKAKQPSQYESIAKFLNGYEVAETNDYTNIDKINFYQNKIIIDRFTDIINSAQKSGLVRSIVLIIISFLVIFNTIRLAIYSAREEIGVMRLVGASNRFISGPFVIEGILYGILSSIITMVIFYPIIRWLGSMFLSEPFGKFIFSDINVFNYYLSNFFQIFITLLLTGTIVGALSSLIAVRRYLKV